MQKKDYPKLRSCPFCGGEALLRERYIAGIANRKHYRRECRHCKATFADWYRSIKKADEAWNRRTDLLREVTNMVPLTLEQLKQMDGEPVWCADGEGHSCYCLVNAESEDCIDSECGAWCFGFYGMTGDGENGLHNMGWLAYDHKPGGEQDA